MVVRYFAIGVFILVSIICVINVLAELIGNRIRETRSSLEDGQSDYPAVHIRRPVQGRSSITAHPLPRRTSRHGARVSLPLRTMNTSTAAALYSGARTDKIYDFPKCYKCRTMNLPGQPQTVFIDAQAHNYYCHRGHRFTGLEH